MLRAGGAVPPIGRSTTNSRPDICPGPCDELYDSVKRFGKLPAPIQRSMKTLLILISDNRMHVNIRIRDLFRGRQHRY